MNKERLTTLAEHLQKNVKPEAFDFGVYFNKHECGSVGCALGHGARIPEFIKLGFELDVDSEGNPSGPIFGGLFGADAAEKFFDLSSEEAEFLFYPGTRTCPLDEDASVSVVAEHILSFVRNGGIDGSWHPQMDAWLNSESKGLD